MQFDAILGNVTSTADEICNIITDTFLNCGLKGDHLQSMSQIGK